MGLDRQDMLVHGIFIKEWDKHGSRYGSLEEQPEEIYAETDAMVRL